MSESASASADKYADYSREQLLAEINRLKKNKKYGLVWEHKKEQVIEDFETQQPYLQEVTEKRIENAPGEPTNLIIEGDNFEALSILNYTHAGKVDVIYIDPPYNTGAKDWVYNNDYVDENDAFRHSKWINMMSARLELAKNLLRETGFIVCAIDHYELFGLGLLMDEIFGEENRLGVIAVVHKSEGRNQEKFFGTSHEYALFYAKDRRSANFNNVAIDDDVKETFDRKDATGSFRLNNYRRDGGGDHNLRKNKPHFYYPIYVSPDLRTLTTKYTEGYVEVLPITNSGQERTWKTRKETFEQRNSSGLIIAERVGNKVQVFEKYYENQVIKTHWVNPKYHAIHYGTKIVNDILGNDKFDFPKSLFLIEDILKITSRKEDVILDFFAGSGTTGHAVIELNKEDGGHRQFILCTNNGDKGPDSVKIAEDITYPRIKTVITGKRQDGSKYSDGIPANLRYYKIEHKEKKASIDANRLEIVRYLEDIIQVKENAFEQIEVNEDLALYKNSERFVGMVFEPFALEEIIESIKEKNSENKPVKLYVFSYSRDAFEDNYGTDFEIEFVAMPEGLLKTYANIVAETKKEDA